MLLLCTPKFTQTSIGVDKKKCRYSFEYQPVSTNCQTPSIRRVNAKNIARRIAQKNAVQSLVPTCASRGYCSSSPPPSTVHPALHGVVLFIQPSTGSCSSSPNRLDRSGSCSSRGNTTGSCSPTPSGNRSSKPPSNAHCSSRGNTMGYCSSTPTGNYSSKPPSMLTVHLEAVSIGFS